MWLLFLCCDSWSVGVKLAGKSTACVITSLKCCLPSSCWMISGFKVTLSLSHVQIYRLMSLFKHLRFREVQLKTSSTVCEKIEWAQRQEVRTIQHHMSLIQGPDLSLMVTKMCKINTSIAAQQVPSLRKRNFLRRRCNSINGVKHKQI